MPEPIAEQKPAEGFPDVAKANAETIAKLESQGADSLPQENLDTGSALDALRTTKETEAAPVEGEDSTVVIEKKTDAAPPVVDEAVAKVEADKKAAEEAAGNELFKGIELPPKASPRSAEAFASIKIKAAQEIAKRDEELAAVKAKLEEAAKVTANPVTPELEKEITELREFRAKFDIEADPKFKEFDRKAAGAVDFIYSRLKANGVLTDENVESIKKYGGPQHVNMEKILEKITDPSLKRLIENKLTEIETAAFDKEQAIKVAKDNVQGYVAERTKENEQAGKSHNEATKAELAAMMQNMKWLAPRKVEAGAKDEEKKGVETHNAFVAELNKEIEAALADDSAKMRATLLVGTTQLLYLQRVHQAAMEKMSSLEKQLKDANDFITKYKAASGSRLRESAAPPSGKIVELKPRLDLSTPATQHIDDLAKQIMDERRAKQVS